jgi:ppGpp synthetase/RelA/SpoT-type nucleotidyltranferase
MNNSQARRLGMRLRTEISGSEKPTKELLLEIQEFRKGYQESGSTVFDILSEISNKIRKDRIVTFRLKRIESIIGKLQREPHMELDRMWDIAGCRCIFDTQKALLSLRDAIYKKMSVRKENDYLNGKSNGYKALHLYVECPKTKNIVEVQLRTKKHHNWATLVEIVDLIYNKQLKFGFKDNQFDNFFKLLSRLESLELHECQQLIDVEQQQQLFLNICNVFTRNYTIVRQNWLKLEEKPNHNYFVIEVGTSRVPIIQSFEQYASAEDDYFQRFLNTDNNVVLTHLVGPNYKQICFAYSNYILTFHKFIEDYFKILKKMLQQYAALKNRELFKKYMQVFRNNYEIEKSAIEKEIQELRISSNNDTYQKSKMSEWLIELQERINNRNSIYEDTLSLKKNSRITRFMNKLLSR